MALNDILKAQLGRRALLKSSLVGGGTALAGSLFGGLISNPAWGADAAAKYETSVVETASGKLRGVVQQGVQTFRGISIRRFNSGQQSFHGAAPNRSRGRAYATLSRMVRLRRSLAARPTR